jgi:hypothetical protein
MTVKREISPLAAKIQILLMNPILSNSRRSPAITRNVRPLPPKAKVRGSNPLGRADNLA